MKIDATIIDRIVAKVIYDVEWWDYIGAEVSDDQWRLMQMGRLAGISELANALKEVMMADRKTESLSEYPTSSDEPQTCQECEHWSDPEDGCADRHGCKTEPQTERSK